MKYKKVLCALAACSIGISGVTAFAINKMGDTNRIAYRITFDDTAEKYELIDGASLVDGKDGKAVNLDGELKQYVKLEDNITKDMTGDYTISVDFYPKSEDSFARIFDFGSGTDNTMFFTHFGGGMPKFRFKGNDLYGDGFRCNLNEWNNVTITKTGTNAVMYLNGETAATSNTFFNELSLLGETNANYLGKSQYASDAFFNGMIDNLLIYNYGLSELEVKSVLNNEVSLSCSYSEADSLAVELNSDKTTAQVLVKNFTDSEFDFNILHVLYSGDGSLNNVISSSKKVTANTESEIASTIDTYGAKRLVTYITSEKGIQKIAEIARADFQFPNAAPVDTLETTIGVHDPSIFKDPKSGTYYVYSTGMIDIFKSDDLIHWSRTENTLPTVPDCVKEIYKHDTAEEYSNIWAPDMYYNEDDAETPYYLTCSYSDQFGKNNSSMILFRSASPDGPWENGEILFTSSSSDEELNKVNAIDSNICIDHKTGKKYMLYGSFWQGLHLKELNDDFSVKEPKKVGSRIFSRYRGIGGPEGGYIIYNEETDYYYMFASYDSLSDNYAIRVARSKNIEGPYVDHNGAGVDRFDDPESEAGNIYGYKLIGSYQFSGQTTYYAPGHNSVLNDDGEWYLVHHTRVTNGGYATLHVRKMYWNEQGWPVVMPERYSGEQLQPLSEDIITGTWDYISIGDNTNAMLKSKTMTLNSDRSLKYGEDYGTWDFDGDNTLTLNIGGDIITAFVSTAYDRDINGDNIMFSGTDQNNIEKWGKKTSGQITY